MTRLSQLLDGRSWATVTRAYQFLFYTLLFSGVFLVVFSQWPALQATAEIVTGLVLISAALVASLESRHFYLILTSSVVMFVSHVASVVFDLGDLAVVARGLVIGFIVMLSVVLARDVFFRAKTVDAQVLYGAMSLYLLIGFCFAYAYAAAEQFNPGSISGLSDGNAKQGLIEFFYFSFITLTTLGYGDMAPVKPVARGLSMVEALLGQIYLAVVIARVVAMSMLRR